MHVMLILIELDELSFLAQFLTTLPNGTWYMSAQNFYFIMSPDTCPDHVYSLKMIGRPFQK